MRRRRLPLIVVSIAIHVVVVLALWISSVWDIEALERGSDHLANLAVLDMKAPPAGNPTPKPQEFVPKPHKHVTHDIVQPTVKPPETPAPPTITTDIPGDKPGEVTDTPGHCDTPPCAPVEQKAPEVKPPPPPVVTKPRLVKPADLAALRISGETQIHPSEIDKMTLIRSGDRTTWAQFIVCIDVHGTVTSAQMRHSTGLADYDARLAAAIHAWRYRPYVEAGEAKPICSPVRFDYNM